MLLFILIAIFIYYNNWEHVFNDLLLIKKRIFLAKLLLFLVIFTIGSICSRKKIFEDYDDNDQLELSSFAENYTEIWKTSSMRMNKMKYGVKNNFYVRFIFPYRNSMFHYLFDIIGYIFFNDIIEKLEERLKQKNPELWLKPFILYNTDWYCTMLDCWYFFMLFIMSDILIIFKFLDTYYLNIIIAYLFFISLFPIFTYILTFILNLIFKFIKISISIWFTFIKILIFLKHIYKDTIIS